uniref:Uncharacterized protein n=1 Tax=Vitis vinifera TaxID=29760 RepID=F6H474_VITVI
MSNQTGKGRFKWCLFHGGARSSGGEVMEFNEEECWRVRSKILLELFNIEKPTK